MTDPVSLENLHEMTGGDDALERELFQVFLSTSEDCLAALKASCTQGAEETWRTQAHAWKGMCLNLGAEKLGQLCATAQTSHTAPPEQRTQMLLEIAQEYALVKTYLEKILAA